MGDVIAAHSKGIAAAVSAAVAGALDAWIAPPVWVTIVGAGIIAGAGTVTAPANRRRPRPSR